MQKCNVIASYALVEVPVRTGSALWRVGSSKASSKVERDAPALVVLGSSFHQRGTTNENSLDCRTCTDGSAKRGSLEERSILGVHLMQWCTGSQSYHLPAQRPDITQAGWTCNFHYIAAGGKSNVLRPQAASTRSPQAYCVALPQKTLSLQPSGAKTALIQLVCAHLKPSVRYK